MAQIGATPGGGVTRLALGDEDFAARELLKRWMLEAGLAVCIDDFGNMIARRGRPGGLAVQVGSHLDTVVRGGRFDGVVGVLGGLEVIRTLNDANVSTAHPIELINWTNEEGARFRPAMLGSGAATAVFESDWVCDRTDADGVRVGDALERNGYRGKADCRVAPGVGYIELHIEQGPVLDGRDVVIGIVGGIVGITWIDIIVRGSSAHAGPTPMESRRDALVAAADIVTLVRRIGSELGESRAATVGTFQVEPNVVNTIPGIVRMTVDFRAATSEALDAMVAKLQEGVEGCATAHQVEIEIDRYWTSDPTQLNSEIISRIERVAAALGVETVSLWSGAGHDAKYLAAITPTGMIFIRSRGGVSHCEEELSNDQDVVLGTQLLLDTVIDLAGMGQ